MEQTDERGNKCGSGLIHGRTGKTCDECQGESEYFDHRQEGWLNGRQLPNWQATEHETPRDLLCITVRA